MQLQVKFEMNHSYIRTENTFFCICFREKIILGVNQCLKNHCNENDVGHLIINGTEIHIHAGEYPGTLKTELNSPTAKFGLFQIDLECA